MFKRVTPAFKAMIDALLGENSTGNSTGNANDQRDISELESALLTTKANEILSKSTPDGALSIMERMESKIVEKENRSGKILVAKAITDIGTTYDREVHPLPEVHQVPGVDPAPEEAPADDPKDSQILIRAAFLLLIAIVIALVAYFVYQLSVLH